MLAELNISIEHVKIIVSILQVFVTGLGVLVAFMGLRTWRQKLMGTTQFELAKNILTKTYRFREGMKRLRRLIRERPIADTPQGEWELEVKEWREDFQLCIETIIDLEVLALESEVFFGELVKQKVIELKQLFYDVRYAVENHLLWKKPNGFGLEFVSPEDQKENRRIIRGDSSEKDELHNRLLCIIEDMNKILKPIIARPRKTFWDRLADWFPFHRV